ncbi:acyltransferase [Pectobacterium brasiliense]|uniref:acyltransferase n=1 Tax=Pectobacterium brasiliense TaxID=180957 RepID=UPI00227A4326|nr:acyltransferase [Pectobacterium brasiliense]WGL29295.1 acyltransferase [Pectobacterium brasiliense]
MTAIFPDVPFLMRLRGALYTLFVPKNKCGKNFQVSSNVVIKGVEYLFVGNDVYIGPNCVILLRNSLVLQDEVMIAPNCVIADGNHGLSGGSYRYAKGNNGPIFIGKGSWIAANCVILHTTKIGESTVIGAGSVISGDFKSNSIYVSHKPKKL